MKGYGYRPEAQGTAAAPPDGAWVERSGVERRSGMDKRSAASRVYFLRGGPERRKNNDRRQTAERRDGWLPIGNWRSICVFDSAK